MASANTLKVNCSRKTASQVSSSPEAVASVEAAAAEVAEVEAHPAVTLNRAASFQSQVVAKTRNAPMSTLQATCPAQAKLWPPSPACNPSNHLASRSSPSLTPNNNSNLNLSKANKCANSVPIARTWRVGSARANTLTSSANHSKCQASNNNNSKLTNPKLRQVATPQRAISLIGATVSR